MPNPLQYRWMIAPAFALALLGCMGCNEKAKSKPVGGLDDLMAEQSSAEVEAPVDHETLRRPPADPRAALEAALASGEIVHDGDDNRFLAQVLEVCGVPVASQVLVFSKTSQQNRLITPSNPRAIYFSDDCYVGFVPGGLIELSDTDPDEGTGFYAFHPRSYDTDRPLDVPVSCLNCHASSRTNHAPGLLVRSVYPDADGFPIGGAGSFVTGHASPLEKRWGGWYVTGEHGTMRHMGNVIAHETEHNAELDMDSGANRDSLDDLIRTDRYLAPGSDIVALMVLEHQVEMHNLLTQGAAAVRKQTFRSRRIVDSSGDTPFDPYESDTLMSLVNHRAQRIVEHMLFADELVLTAPVRGDRAFLRQFRANRRETDAGHSLKDFELTTRLFRYRCSYMIYARAFDLMPELLKEAVYRELFEALTGDDTELNGHLDPAEREAILTILRATKPDLPAYWQD
ncbi:MAG: hypothetical protein ACIAXF_01940 [Phycisphaerales bacterium JB063]